MIHCPKVFFLVLFFPVFGLDFLCNRWREPPKSDVIARVCPQRKTTRPTPKATDTKRFTLRGNVQDHEWKNAETLDESSDFSDDKHLFIVSLQALNYWRLFKFHPLIVEICRAVFSGKELTINCSCFSSLCLSYLSFFLCLC